MKRLLFLCLLPMALLQFSCSNDDDETQGSNPDPQPVAECTYQGSLELSTQAEVDAFGAQGYCAINGSVTIGNNNDTPSNITNLNAFKDILHIGGYLNIANNTNLTSLEGLHNLKFVGFFIVHNSGIENFMGLRSLESISDDTNTFTQIINNPNLRNLRGLEKLKRLEKTEIANNPSLTSLEGLQNIETIYRTLSISSCPLLTDLGLESISSMGALQINNTAISSLDGLENMTNIGSVELTNNPQMTSIDGLNGLTKIDAKLLLENLPQLSSIQALGNVSDLGSLYIVNCDALTSLQGLGGVSNLSEAKIEGNAGLVSLNGLQNLVKVKSIYIENNNNLATIEHLSALSDISPSYHDEHTTLAIRGNASLTSLHGLEGIMTDVTWVYVLNNSSLQDLCAIRGMILTYGVLNTFVSGNVNPVTAEDIRDGNCN